MNLFLFEILLQNNDQEYLDKIFSSNQNDIKLAIKEKFIEWGEKDKIIE